MLGLEAEQEALKAETEMGMKLLKKDVREKQDTIITLREEMGDMKRKHWEQLHNADSARERAELRVLEVQSHQEKRVGNLEVRLQELSQSVGNYE